MASNDIQVPVQDFKSESEDRKEEKEEQNENVNRELEQNEVEKKRQQDGWSTPNQGQQQNRRDTSFTVLTSIAYIVISTALSLYLVYNQKNLHHKVQLTFFYIHLVTNSVTIVLCLCAILLHVVAPAAGRVIPLLWTDSVALACLFCMGLSISVLWPTVLPPPAGYVAAAISGLFPLVFIVFVFPWMCGAFTI